MTTIDLIREAERESAGVYLLGHVFLKQQLRRWGCAGTAIALLERRAAQRPDATHFRVEAGGHVTFFRPAEKKPVYFPGEIIDPRIEVRTVRRKGCAPRREFFVDGTRHVKYACAVAALRETR